ncbi:putative bifunctional diguanylate cyclase/phosphodiesterase [Gayadomonas joobiniege]|uniref:putative bifunctional diguanylate cyclase/phosphodiesterase n=1 Tax=Gayadomonas joobiniege TaxID=1234606 RepID=UPI00038281C1|nr:bifunctional diguanylate cyclase/phosphodiesterase [Gayadomonas joobiniege]
MSPSDEKQAQLLLDIALKEVEYLKNHDGLTGLHNLAAMFKTFANWHSAGQMYGVLYLDINHFNLIEQMYGHEISEQILVETAARLQANQPKHSLIARVGSDEFVVLLPLKEIEEAHAHANRLLASLQQKYYLKNNTCSITCCIGIGIYPNNGSALEHVVQKAASAVLKAKHDGLTIAYYQPAFHRSLCRKLAIDQALRVAIQNQKLEIFLQPKVRLHDQSVSGYEALLRWDDNTLGTVAPAEFVKVAEQMGLATEIDQYVLDAVFKFQARQQASGLTLSPIAVNITSSHFNSQTLPDFIFECAQKYAVPVNIIELELTEGTLMHRDKAVLQNMDTLRDAGIRIYIDDFGTGYSSFVYLRDLRVDGLKIDQSFVREMDSERGLGLVHAIISLAKASGLVTIAEGVETEKQSDRLVELGCNYGQGYFYGRPKAITNLI